MRSIAAAGCLIGAGACGGGGDTTNAPPPPATQTASSITSQPVDASVTSGQAAAFSVGATGAAPLTYQWRRNGAPVAGATAASYTTPPTTMGDHLAAYSVMVSNAAGSVVSRDAALTVTPAVVAPTIVTSPAAITVAAGQAATFSVVATGTAPLTYQWRKNGNEIAGATAASYATPPATMGDNGAVFAVAVSNSGGTAVSAPALLTVTPPPMLSLARQSRIAVGAYAGHHSLARKADGSVWGWGNNQFGQLAAPPAGPVASPVRLSVTGSRIVSIGAGQHHSTLVDDQGRVFTAGFNHNGVLGTGTPIGAMQASFQAAAITDVAAVASGNYANVVIRTDGTVWEFGYTPRGGSGALPRRVDVPTAAVAVTIGQEYRFALLADGSLWFWGTDAGVAAGAPSVRGEPARVPGLTGVIAMTSGGGHMLAVKADGTVWSWGYGTSRQLGFPITGTYSLTPQQVPGLTDVVAVAGGWDFSLALRRDGTVWAWGDNSRSQLGLGITSASELPRQIAGLSGVTDIAAGDLHSLFVTSDGSVWVAGQQTSLLQLGIPGTTLARVPTRIPGLNLD